MTLASFRRLLRSISNEEFAALLRELGVALYERDIREWRVLSGISDELLDRSTLKEREELAEVIIRRYVPSSRSEYR